MNTLHPHVPPIAEAVLSRAPLLKGRTLTIAPLEGVVSLNNQSFIVTSEGHEYLLRLASPDAHWLGIRRDEELRAAQAAAEAGLSPRIQYAEPEGHLLVDFVRGHHWTPEEAQIPHNIQRLGKTLRRLHDIRSVKINGSIYGRIDRLIESAVVLQVALPPHLPVLQEALQQRETAAQATEGFLYGLNHHDLWLNNFLDDGENLWLLDWEFAGVGSGLYDLATAALGGHFDEGQKQILLDAYGLPGNVRPELENVRFEVYFFEAAWALVQHGLRGSASFDYQSYAQSTFVKLCVAAGVEPL